MKNRLTLPIQTERLTLRPLSVDDDLDDHQRLYANPSTVRWLYDEVKDREGARQHLRQIRASDLPEKDGSWMHLAVDLNGAYLGFVGAGLNSTAHRQWEVGFVFLPEGQGRGYATEASRATIDIAFDRGNAHRVIGRLEARNSPSARVLERLGMRREGLLVENEWVKGEWQSELVYAVTEQEWRREARAIIDG
jgi:RimJ/RimL family protein N-acetyltransferase